MDYKHLLDVKMMSDIFLLDTGTDCNALLIQSNVAYIDQTVSRRCPTSPPAHTQYTHNM